MTPEGARVRNGPGGVSSALVKRSIAIRGHRTSVSLEDAFWSQLKHIAQGRTMSVSALIAEIDAGRGRANLSSAIRVFVLESALQ